MDYIFLPIVLAVTTLGTIVTDIFLPRPPCSVETHQPSDLSNQSRMVGQIPLYLWPYGCAIDYICVKFGDFYFGRLRALLSVFSRVGRFCPLGKS